MGQQHAGPPCDLDEGHAEAVETVVFAVEGQVLESSLCADHVAAFRHAMERWAACARPTRPRPPKRPVQARAQQRFERMLDAADEILAERGLEAATTTLIAERAGTSIGSIYNFLGDKHAVARALSERYVTEVGAAGNRLVRAGGRPDALAAGLVDVVADLFRRHGGLAPVLRSRGPSADLRAARAAVHDSLDELIERLLVGRAADATRRRRVAGMCAQILWHVVGEIVERPAEEQDQALAELRASLAAYLSAALGASTASAPIGRAS